MQIALVARHATPPTHAADPYSADQAAHIAGLSRALALEGNDVTVYARKDSPDLPAKARLAPRLTAEYVDAGPATPIPADQAPHYAKDIASHLASAWREKLPDVVHAFHWTGGLAALGAARDYPVPILATFGSLVTAERRHRIAGECSATRTRMEPCIAKALSGVLAISSDEVAELSRLGIPNARVRIIPVGVDTKRFKPEGLVAKRKRLVRLVTVGPLAEYRSLDVMLKCLTDLPDTELVIAGGPSAAKLESDHGYRILAKLAADLGVTDRVQFTGHVSDSNLPTLLRSADLFVSCARYEPQAITVLQAMACGVPVVAPAIGIYRDAVIDGTTGSLVPPGRPDLLGRRLRDLVGSPMRRAAYGIAAADRAKSRYPWERVAQETVTAYEHAVARAARREPALPAGPAAADRFIQPGAAHARPARSKSTASRPARKRARLLAAGDHAA
ncbi:MAG TPA: glycosyltransferase [Streptosporangiaceae bacterium]|nr:glycosyltransferase [Streptosporangiaceae bacterium]